MNKTIIFFTILIISFGCKQNSKEFDFTIKGTVIGQNSGTIVYNISPRVGDEIEIPILDGKFEHHGKANELIISSLAFGEDVKTGSWSSMPIIIEPGTIEIILNRDSIYDKSKVLTGENSLRRQNINQILNRYDDEIYSEENSENISDSLFYNVYNDSILNLIITNSNNFSSIVLINWYAKFNLFDSEQLNLIFNEIKEPELKNSLYFKKVYSKYLAQKGNYNQIGSKAINFDLQDSTGKTIYFSSIAKNNMVYVEESGSWCGNQTRESRKLKTIYNRYKNYGFKIITVVSESNLDRWKNWVLNNEFSWTNLVELDFDNSKDLFFSEQLFLNGDYLVNDSGIVVANNLTPERLDEILMEKYEPQKYAEYQKEKWELPQDTYILDKDKPINTFEELASKFPNKAFFIDCYATWCSPCIQEFKYKKELMEFLSKQNIELVYISFDKNIDDGEWLSFIKKHNLTGYHMRANEEFKNDFETKAKYEGQLPNYMIVDKNGKIIVNNAHRPSNKEELFLQLKTNLN